MIRWQIQMMMLGLLLLCSSWSLAQQAADEQLLSLAKTAFERRLWSETENQAMALREQYPQSRYEGEATVLLFRALEYLNEPARMETLRQEVLTRWPQTDFAWQVMEADFNMKYKVDRDAAIRQLTENLEHPALNPIGRTRALGLLLRTLATTNPEQFITRATAMMATIDQHTAPEEMEVNADIARRLYRPLFEHNQWEQAQAINTRCQQAILRAKAPADGYQADAIAYYGALAAVAPARLLATLPPLRQQLPQIGAAQNVIGPAVLVRMAYPLLYRAQGLEVVDELHTQISKTLIRLNNPEGCVQADFQAYCQILEQADPRRFQELITREAAGITATKTAQEAAPLLTASLRLYAPMLAAGQNAEAVALRERNDAELRRIGLLYYVFGNRFKNHTAYYDALQAADPERFLTEALAVLAKVDKAPDNLEARFHTDLARRVYGTLLKRNRGEEARRIHQQVQATLCRFQDADSTTPTDQQAYFTALQQANPKAYLDEAVSTITELDKVTPAMYKYPTQALGYLGKVLASQLYLPLVKADRLADAHIVLTSVLAAIERMGDPTDLRVTNQSAYLFAIQEVAPEEHTQLLTQTHQTAMALLQKAARPADLTYPLQLARDVLYRPFAVSQRIMEAQTLHHALYTTARRLQMPLQDVMAAEMPEYLKTCVNTQPEVAYTEMLAWVTAAQGDKTPVAIQDAVAAARYASPQVYPYLMRTKQLTRADALSTGLQEIIGNLPNSALQVLQARVAYLVELAPYAPDAFLLQSEADIAALAPTSTADEVGERAKLVRAAYSCLLVTGRLEETIALHARVQTALKACNNADAVDTDNQAYTNALSGNAVELIFTRFQNAFKAKQADEAQQWLTILNTVAPEHPRAREARKLIITLGEDAIPAK